MKSLQSTIASWDTYTKRTGAIILLFTIIVGTFTALYHVSGDGCWHTSVARFIAQEQQIPYDQGLGRGTVEPFWAPPLYHILSGIVIGTTGEFFAKFVSLLFSILSLILIFKLATKLYNSKVGFYTVVFLGSIPLFVDYSILNYVESMLTFFVILSVYLGHKQQFVWASIVAGIAILTKYNGAFVLPVLAYMAFFKTDKPLPDRIKDLAIVSIVPILIGLPWLIRNWILLGNPVWPFLNFIFQGIPNEGLGDGGFTFSRLISPLLLVYTFLGLFGVPNGDPRLLSYLTFPLLKAALFVWILGCTLYLLPLLKARLGKHKDILLIWILSYLLLFLIYVVNAGFAVTRIVIPLLPALAIVWALGMDNLTKKKYAWIVLILLVGIVGGFYLTEAGKVVYAKNQWNHFDADFTWVQENIPQDAILLSSWQCGTYNFHRQAVTPTDVQAIDQTDYIWYNQQSGLDFNIRESVDQEILKRQYPVVYENNKTGTTIFEVKN